MVECSFEVNRQVETTNLAFLFLGGDIPVTLKVDRVQTTFQYVRVPRCVSSPCLILVSTKQMGRLGISYMKHRASVGPCRHDDVVKVNTLKYTRVDHNTHPRMTPRRVTGARNL